MSWFKKHLNWTLIIGVLVVETPIGILSIYGLDNIDITLLLIAVGSVIVAEFLLEIWYLYQKKRSYFYLLCNLFKPYYIPVGFAFLLCLSNKRKQA